jgi:cell division protein FtsB
MEQKKLQLVNRAPARDEAPGPMPRRALDWTLRVWRTAASALAVALAVLIGWHVVSGKNGLSAWQQKRVEDRELRKEIDGLAQENARLRERIVQLNSNPDAIGIVARDQLHYAKPNEVIVALPPEPQTQGEPAVANK